MNDLCVLGLIVAVAFGMWLHSQIVFVREFNEDETEHEA